MDEVLSPALFAVRSWSGRVTYSGKAQDETPAEDVVDSCYDYFPGGNTIGGDDDVVDEAFAAVDWDGEGPVEEVSEEDKSLIQRQQHVATDLGAWFREDYESDEFDAQRQHRELLERMAEKRAAEVEAKMIKEAREARQRATKTHKLAERAAARQAARHVSSHDEHDETTGERDAAREAAEEAARVERVRATRRRQKEQYKRLLEELTHKRRQEEIDRAEAARRRKAKMASTFRSTGMVKTKNAEPVATELAEGAARGSGVRAVRASRQSSDDENNSEAARRRRECNRLVREKQQHHLERLISERRKREEEKAALAQRLARRQKLRTERLLAELGARRSCQPQVEEDGDDNDELAAGAPAPALDAAAAKPESNSSEEDEGHRDPRRRLSAAEQRAMIERLNSTRAASNAQAPAARDFADWKRKRGIEPDKRVFVMTGWYPCVRDALIERGWVQNPDRDSPFFDLKWTLTSQHLRQSTLESWQYANHFQKTRSIVTKVGLSQSLASLQWFARETCDAIYPRCYDLSRSTEARAFVEDFRGLEAMRVLQAIVRLTRGARDRDEPSPPVNDQVYAAAMSVCRRHRRLRTAEDIDDPPGTRENSAAAVYNELLAAVAAALDTSAADAVGAPVRLPELPVPSQIDAALDAHQLQNDAAGGGRGGDHHLGQTVASAEAARREAYRDKQATLRERRARDRVVELAAKPRDAPLDTDQLGEAERLLADLTAHSPQSGLDGMCGGVIRNLWIVKPAAKSRGRGIATFRSLDSLFEYCEMIPPRGSEDASRWKPGGSMWIVQKYIENQLLIANRKFDLRQWVLVTKWNPLTIWFYDECYARFSAAEFSLDDADLRNDYVHLVNNSISKNSRNFHSTVVAENGVEIVDCMWTLDQFRAYMAWRHQQKPFGSGVETSADLFTNVIQPAMQHIVTCALACAQETVEHRHNSWELYGFDFMLDDTSTPWLIEINSSPACDYSTAVTEAFVQRALVDILKVTFDHARWTANRDAGTAKTEDAPDTGGWKRIHVGPFLDTPVAAFGGGADIVCRGTSIPEPRDFRRWRLARQQSASQLRLLASSSSSWRSQTQISPDEEHAAECHAPAPPVTPEGLIEGPAEPAATFVEHQQPPRPPHEPMASAPFSQRKGTVAISKKKPAQRKHPVVPIKITNVPLALCE
ncbi:hypothetical protein CTAYLR_008364 [Chrysophaeum taylorii]|uniref:Uncharacterized protein n=1 Tax=Chrysophaeum taylorii TaxID=2483200 RepID=A0AAD7UNP5_9STRA|nr:hypothetical protein CTAYLR_008364 [Chrysophaeum taylorii]